METFELFKCEWPVHQDGYLIKGKTRQILPVSSDAVIYNPLDHSGLFYDFAKIQQTEAGVLEFANKYGLLRTAGPNYMEQWITHIKVMNALIDSMKSDKHSKQALNTIETQMQVVPKFDPGTLNIHFWPVSLLAAMYLQFALAVRGNKTYKQCAWCGTTFEITPRIARSNRVFCSNACKQAEYRHRNKRK